MKNKKCDPNDIAIKSFFLGPQAENADILADKLLYIFERWFRWRRGLFPTDGRAISPSDKKLKEYKSQTRKLFNSIEILMNLFENEIPKFSPRYIGHMTSEVSIPALIGHIVALLHNPNNISTEASRAGIEIERRAIADLALMLRLKHKNAKGHFTSGGTIANFESLWRAKTRLYDWLSVAACAEEKYGLGLDLFHAGHIGWELYQKFLKTTLEKDCRRFHLSHANPFQAVKNLEKVFSVDFNGPIALIPAHAHYSWEKGLKLIGLGSEDIWPIDVNARGALDLNHLTSEIQRAQKASRPVLLVASVFGSTELGVLDPIDRVGSLLNDFKKDGVDIWHHIDAAYGGFFASMGSLNPEIDQKCAGFAVATSITLDPHKLGYVPFSSGTFICPEEKNYDLQKIEIPYIEHTKKDPTLVTLEGSRAAVGAVSTWLTSNVVGFNSSGYGRILNRTIATRKEFEAALNLNKIVLVAPDAETNILCFSLCGDSRSLVFNNKLNLLFYKRMSPLHKNPPFYVSKTVVLKKKSPRLYKKLVKKWKLIPDSEEIVLIRLVLMNPFLSSKEPDVSYIREFCQEIDRFAPVIARNQHEVFS